MLPGYVYPYYILSSIQHPSPGNQINCPLLHSPGAKHIFIPFHFLVGTGFNPILSHIYIYIYIHNFRLPQGCIFQVKLHDRVLNMRYKAPLAEITQLGSNASILRTQMARLLHFIGANTHFIPYSYTMLSGFLEHRLYIHF